MLRGTSVSGGIAVGRAVVVRTDHGWVARLPIAPDEADAECLRLRQAAAAASRRLESLARGGSRSQGEVAAILSAHAMIAVDPVFLEPVERRIRREHVRAEWALRATAEEFRRRLESSADPVFSERGGDVIGVARAIAAEMSEGKTPDFDLSSWASGTILVADELSPAQAARLNPHHIAAIALERGGPNSHAAIIARSFGIPAVVGVEGLVASTGHLRPILVDGDRGTVETRPTPVQLRRAIEKVQKQRRESQASLPGRPVAVKTADGVEIALRANLELPEEAPSALAHGACGIGLFRSEFLYLRSDGDGPSVDEQEEAYGGMLELCQPHPVVVRTYDLGGEKDLAAPGQGSSPLGLRGIRFSLSEPAMFRDQLRALLRASRRGDLRILLPMVTSPAEVAQTRHHLSELSKEEGIPVPPVGAMIEVPAAVLLADGLARLCDFFSIGTNDLAQYLLAADRTDARVVAWYQPLSPAVLKMIKSVVETGRRAGRPVSVCGEIAGDPIGAAVLLGLGVTELSMSPVLLPRLHELCRRLCQAPLAALAAKALECMEAGEVEEIFHAAVRKADV